MKEDMEQLEQLFIDGELTLFGELVLIFKWLRIKSLARKEQKVIPHSQAHVSCTYTIFLWHIGSKDGKENKPPRKKAKPRQKKVKPPKS